MEGLGRLMKDNLQKLFTLFLGAFLLLIGQLAYWQVIAAPSLQANPANQRAWELEKSTWRGGIYDRYGEILAVSRNSDNNKQLRIYPLGEEAVHIIGYNSRKYGKSGLEASYNGELLGINEEGSIRNLVYSVIGRKKRGQDLILTLDNKLQEIAYKALGNHRGSIAIINPRTGEILALISKPSFSPDQLGSQWVKLNTDKNSPLLNRATQGLYPPGSTLKILIAGAALEKGITNEKELFHCPGYIIINGRKLSCYNNEAHGEIDLSQALQVSCNVTFAKLGIRLGINGLNDYLSKMEKLDDSRLGIFLADSNLLKGKYLSPNGLAERAIGQGETLTTPFYMASLVGAIANNGTLMKPYLISEIRSSNGKIITKNLPIKEDQLFSPQVAQEVVKMMEKVVKVGTGKKAQIDGLDIAGKTGTAENPHGKSHAWFIGFAPSQDPQLAIAVIVENGGTGGTIAAPIAKEIFLNALENK